MSRRRLSLTLAAGFGGWALGRASSADRLPVVGDFACALLPFTPQVAGAAWLAALLAPDDGASFLTGLAATALTGAVAPRAIPRRPAPALGPSLRVLTANLLIGRAGADAVVELVRRQRPDVFFVQELSPAAQAGLSQAGLDRLLPHHISDHAAAQPRGNAIYARHRLEPDAEGRPTSSIQPVATLRHPAGPVHVACVHLHTPKRPWRSPGVTPWRRDLAEVAAFPLPSWPGDTPVVLAGDFNATLDHWAFRNALRSGLVDAARQAGRGLVPTWGPFPGGRGAVLTLDHVLVDGRCAVLGVSVHRLPGTDHRAVFARLRLPRAEPLVPRSGE